MFKMIKYILALLAINLINRCHIWADLHNFNKNIRLESHRKEEK